MNYIQDPGLWQHYILRTDNVSLPIETLRRKYLAESIAFEEHISQLMNSHNYINSSLGGPGIIPTTPDVLPSNCIEFVTNTTNGTSTSISFTSSAPTTYTLNWGDGNTESGEADGGLSLNHTYPISSETYTSRLCFADISTITEIDFPGNN